MANESNGWNARRIPRRRVLRGAGMGLAGLTTLRCASPAAPPVAAPTATSAAGAPPAAASSPAVAATAAPKRGGTLKNLTTSGPRSLDPHAAAAASAVGATGPLFCYSLLVTFKYGPDIKAPAYIPTGDLA